MTTKPTLLTWLLSASIERIKQLTGLSETGCYNLLNELSLYGLSAFNYLAPDVQYNILNQFVSIYRD